MEIQCENTDNLYQITAYGCDSYTVNDKILRHSFIVSPKHLVAPWDLNNIQQLTAERLSPLLALQPEIILFGTGPTLIFPPLQLIQPLFQQKIGYEFMDSRAAARTFNVLCSEKRNIAAAIIL